ncbi:hypothetical protein [Allostreptomyces psammosilenae]|uniref:Uncharacterized protein n=1 Tax=Allostreptomyces psammosilenae TaxID=1892865 RepID=A0A852ZQK3_9ACTN|nr:hypothetical protein [Allostreptomyces psammosilenae]NYI04035.1 hypothetical protein [Allostreptomyces psammosilenae]
MSVTVPHGATALHSHTAVGPAAATLGVLGTLTPLVTLEPPLTALFGLAALTLGVAGYLRSPHLPSTDRSLSLVGFSLGLFCLALAVSLPRA